MPLDLERGVWRGVYAPGEVSRAIVVTLNPALSRALVRTEVKDRLAALQIEMSPMTLEAYRKFAQAKIAKWAQVIQRAKITIE